MEGSGLMTMIGGLAEDIRTQGDAFDSKRILINVTKHFEHKLWLSQTTAFLKHADRDAENHLSADELDNEKMLMATCAAYIELMKRPTPEITAYFAFWAVKNSQVDDLAKEAQKFARQLKNTNETRRHRLCAQFIRHNK